MVVDVEYYQELSRRVSSKSVNRIELDRQKNRYMNEIKSIRSFDSISSLRDLIHILEKRDCINENNIQILEEIAVSLRIELPLINQPSHGPSAARNVTRTGSPFGNSSPHMPHNSGVLPPVAVDAKARAYDLIVREIGSKWRDLGRKLGIRHGQLDNLENIEFSERIYKILDYAEKNNDPRRWRSTLLNALVEARRKDLKNEVESIFNTY